MQLVSITLEQCLDIRHTVLWPHLARNASRVEGDEDAWHFGVAEDGKIVSCLSVFMLDERRCQIRKFATLQAHQQQGYGRFLLQSVLEKLVRAGVDFVQLDARTSAAAFYARFGFMPQGEPFYKQEVQYIRMSRTL
ncbi:GNAT family N-acetyltransferase [Kosakonia sacchari]|uniref:GNAT family N-acetyltransferase n=1 Tax=Kosakonia sacchari TaxID=1158459 RepID=UPI000BE547F5|nr:GNAT family N-acetyltransferase [Kosakonia sacchari]PDO87138.1 GNAT family N-acetyltransferase [Kosakonia sacchari]